MLYPESNRAGSEGSANKTIHDLAMAARKRALAAITEAEFARACMLFDAAIVPEELPPHLVTDEEGYDNQDDKLAQTFGVLKLLAQTTEVKSWNLGLIWLDGKGFGGWTLQELFGQLERYR